MDMFIIRQQLSEVVGAKLFCTLLYMAVISYFYLCLYLILETNLYSSFLYSGFSLTMSLRTMKQRKMTKSLIQTQQAKFFLAPNNGTTILLQKLPNLLRHLRNKYSHLTSFRGKEIKGNSEQRRNCKLSRC